MDGQYNYHNCQSLFGYARKVHHRSGGICQLCGAGDALDVDFNLWRQLTVEHLIGESQGGYINRIKPIIDRRFPELSNSDREAMAMQIDEANTVTACSFCNAMTSRVRNPETMEQLIMGYEDDHVGLVNFMVQKLQRILEQKRRDVSWKLVSIKDAFEKEVKPELIDARHNRRATIAGE